MAQRRTSCRCLAARAALPLLLALLGTWAGPDLRSTLGTEDLVAGAPTGRTDPLGVSWTPDAQGRVNTSLGWAISATQYNQANFAVQQERLRRDGSEVVLDGAVGSISVQRRVAFDTRRGGVRVVDVLSNATQAAQTVQVIYWSQPTQPFTRVATASGGAVGGELSDGETGVLGYLTGTPSNVIVYGLCASEGGFRPSVQLHGNQNLQISYTVVVPAGGTTSLAIGIRLLLGVQAAAQAPGQLATYDGPEWLADLPSEIRRSLVNLGGQGRAAPATLPDLASLLSVAPGTLDQLAFASDTLVMGTARCERLEIQTDFGSAQVPFEQVAALVGGLHPSHSPGVFLRDGQRLIGQVTCKGLAFEMSSGLSMDLDPAQVDRLVLRKAPPDETQERMGWLVETQDGLRLRATPRAQAFEASTRWGPLELHLDQVVSVQSGEAESFGMTADLEDGSRFRLYLGAEPLHFDTPLFGPIQLEPWRVAAIVRDRRLTEESGRWWSKRREQPSLELSGGDLFVGRLDCDAVHFTQAGNAIPQPPAQIRRLQNLLGGSAPEAGEAVRFEAEIWGGGKIAGELQELVLPFRTTYGVLHVPARDVVEVRSPTPLVPEVVRTRVARLIEQLGDPDWSRREAATTELRELGEIARFAIEDALEAAVSPEVERRLRRVLETQ